MLQKQPGILPLLNPPLVLAAAAECFAGALIGGAGLEEWQPYVAALASALLFGAGSLFGHYFDRDVDARHFPDRPLPAGEAEPQAVWRLGWVLLLLGLAMTVPLGRGGMLASVGVSLLVVLYAAATKTVPGLGFLTLGAARAVNLILGESVEEFGVAVYAAAALPVLFYGVGWGVLRASKQPGAPPASGLIALIHFGIAASLLLLQALGRFAYRADSALPLVPFLALTFPRFVNALLDGRRPAVLEAVQYGFPGLTLLEATLAAGYSGVWAGLVVCALALGVYAALRRWPVTLPVRPR